MNIDGFKTNKIDTEKLLGVKFDRKLTFDDHISGICKKESRKISALVRITLYTGIVKKRILVNDFHVAV